MTFVELTIIVIIGAQCLHTWLLEIGMCKNLFIYMWEMNGAALRVPCTLAGCRQRAPGESTWQWHFGTNTVYWALTRRFDWCPLFSDKRAYYPKVFGNRTRYFCDIVGGNNAGKLTITISESILYLTAFHDWSYRLSCKDCLLIGNCLMLKKKLPQLKNVTYYNVFKLNSENFKHIYS